MRTRSYSSISDLKFLSLITQIQLGTFIIFMNGPIKKCLLELLMQVLHTIIVLSDFSAAYRVGTMGIPEGLIVLGGFTFVELAFSVSIPVKL